MSAPGKWLDLEYVVRVGEGHDAECDVSISDASGQRETVKGVVVDSGFDRPNWIGFTSTGKEEKSYWIDDFSFRGGQ